MLLIINFFLKGHSSSANLAFRSNTSELHFWSRGLSMKAGESSRFSASWYFVIFSESMIEWRGNIKLVLCMLNLYIFFFRSNPKSGSHECILISIGKDYAVFKFWWKISKSYGLEFTQKCDITITNLDPTEIVNRYFFVAQFFNTLFFSTKWTVRMDLRNISSAAKVLTHASYFFLLFPSIGA